MPNKPKSAAATPQVSPLAQDNTMSIEQMLHTAAQQIDTGHLQTAETIVRQVLERQPGNPFATHLLGIIAHNVGRTELAVDLIGNAIAALPRVAQFHRNRGEMCRLLKRLEEAIEHGERAVALEPTDAVAHSNLGIAYYDREDYEKAEACQQRALQINPNFPQALNNLGSIRRDTKDRDGAIEYYGKALAVAPDYVEARSNMAAVLTELGRPEEALQELARVIQVRPQYAEAHCNFGSAFLRLDQFDKAQAAFSHALSLASDSAAAVAGLARVHKEQHRLEEATAMLERLLAMEPDKAGSHSLAGEIHVAAERYDVAEQAYHKALELDADFAGAILGLGQLQMELGKLEEAQALYQQAMEAEPDEVAPYVFMAQCRKVKAEDDPVFERLQAEERDIASLPPTRALSVHFALGKVYNDVKQYDKAFPHFLEGNRLKRERIQYDADNQDMLYRNISEFFTEETIESLRGAGDPSEVPIFVLGMPRSGTTLVETILASHPEVHGAGELRDLLSIANLPHQVEGGPAYPLSMQGITGEDLTRMGARYVNVLRAHSSEARHVTDKMPANFLALGLIHLMLPNAKIVHVRRNAADTCLSGFQHLFNNSLFHTYNLEELGRYYVGYAKLMDHWRSVLPENAFYEIQYEELVADREAQTRALIEYCGLAWDDACLEHHKTERSVKTASVTQVRQPVYKSSVERWRHYEQFLQPLFDALGEYAPER